MIESDWYVVLVLLIDVVVIVFMFKSKHYKDKK